MSNEQTNENIFNLLQLTCFFFHFRKLKNKIISLTYCSLHAFFPFQEVEKQNNRKIGPRTPRTETAQNLSPRLIQPCNPNPGFRILNLNNFDLSPDFCPASKTKNLVMDLELKISFLHYLFVYFSFIYLFLSSFLNVCTVMSGNYKSCTHTSITYTSKNNNKTPT